MSDVTHRRYAIIRNEYTLPAKTTGDAVQRLLAVLETDGGGDSPLACRDVTVEADENGIRFYTETVTEGVPWTT